MIADDIRISQFRADDSAKEEADDIARLMGASRAIYQLIVIRAQQDSTRIGEWSASSWSNVVEHIRRAVQELEEGELEKE